MKKTIIATLVLVLSVFATATAGGKGETDCSSSKKITMNSGFNKLVVEGNVDVVLFEDDTANEIRTFGESKDMSGISISEKNGVLTIRNKRSSGQKVLIYVPVKRIDVIEAGGHSKVSSATALSKGVTLVAKGDCKFNIVSEGAIEVQHEGEVEVVVEERTIYTASSTVKQS